MPSIFEIRLSMEVVRSPKAISGDAQYSFKVVDGEEANFNFLIVVRSWEVYKKTMDIGIKVR